MTLSILCCSDPIQLLTAQSLDLSILRSHIHLVPVSPAVETIRANVEFVLESTSDIKSAGKSTLVPPRLTLFRAAMTMMYFCPAVPSLTRLRSPTATLSFLWPSVQKETRAELFHGCYT